MVCDTCFTTLESAIDKQNQLRSGNTQCSASTGSTRRTAEGQSIGIEMLMDYSLKKGIEIGQNLHLYSKLGTKLTADFFESEVTNDSYYDCQEEKNKSLPECAFKAPLSISPSIFTILPNLPNAQIDVILDGIEMTSKGGYTSAIRYHNTNGNENLYDDDVKADINLKFTNMKFSNFKTGNGVNGSAVYLWQAANVDIDDKTIFSRNELGDRDIPCPSINGFGSKYCQNDCTPYYGGGTVYIGRLNGRMNTQGEFSQNHNHFNHGQGGAVFIDELRGVVNETGKCNANSAREGVCIHLNTLEQGAKLVMNGTYTNNDATDTYDVCSSRGGVLSLRKHYGDLEMDGIYETNYGAKFGAILRLNRVYNKALVKIEGSFENNEAKMGDIANVWYLYVGSKLSFAPKYFQQSHTKMKDYFYFSRSECENKVDNTQQLPRIEMDGCYE
eukprot:Awhi_evm1s12841